MRMKAKNALWGYCAPSLRTALTAATFLFAGTLALAQDQNIKGRVVDSAGQPIPGVNVIVEGTTVGTTTDFDGNYSLSAPAGASILFSFVGFDDAKQTIAQGQSQYDITLSESFSDLDEVVVVGYGVQKKKLVTGATVQVSGDNIARLNTTSALGALQSQTPGVAITQSTGQAGDGFKVNIRGVGTVGNSSPLYVIDGVAGGDINSLNPSDIESVDVLKDAASAAIYGARAANGVILITTKQGKAGKMSVSYDGYVGAQYLYKKPDVLNAQEYIYARNLMEFNGGNAAPDWENVLPADLYAKVISGEWEGTDWVDESYHEGAATQNHALNITGGNEASKFSMGVAYTRQDGIFGGDRQSQYDRFTARLNSDHVIYKSKKDDRDAIVIGENLTFNRINSNGIALGNMYWNNMHDLLVGNPLLPVRDEEGNYYTNAQMTADGWPLGAAANPMALASMTSMGLKESKSWNLNMSAYLQIKPFKDLTLKSMFAYKVGASTYRDMTMVHAIAADVASMDGCKQQMSSWSSIAWENTIAYAKQLGDHAFDVVIGNSIEQSRYGMNLEATSKNNLFGSDWDRAYVGNTKPTSLDQVTIDGSPADDSSLASFFGRASYNFRETYMAQVTVRADGSSNFAAGDRWGVFPSASIGWVVSNEGFMDGAKAAMDFLKIRASWGQNGNCSIDNFQYLTTFSFADSDSYYFGENNHSSATTGGYADVLKNPDVTWETSEQLNIGLDARFLESRLSLTFDWYKKTTKDWLLQAPILSVYGLSAPYVNGGDVENKGLEIGIGWNDRRGDWSYGVNVNLATNKNEVTKIANAEGIIHGPSSVLHQQEGEVFRAQVGEPIGFFYGLSTEGVFQNQAQIDQWQATHTDKLHGTLRPGDLIYVDHNGDGVIDQSDKHNIGDPNPDLNLGISLNVSWRGWDLSATGAGAFGQQVIRVFHKGEDVTVNLNKKLLYGSWKGEGTSNFLPRLDNMNTVNWQTMSDIWLEDADYFKIQNITLGYDFTHLWKSNCPFSQLRLYVSGQNLATFTDYSGMDPEIGSDGGTGDDGYSWAKGIDNGFYPAARTYLVGLNLKF